jgi:DNA-binding NarL/FixJ family response regulator
VPSGLRVVLAEDLALLRDGLRRLLSANGFDVVEAVSDGPELTRALMSHRPDVAVVDVRLPPTFTDEGLRAAIAARAALPGLPVLVLSQYVEQVYAKELLSGERAGVGYLLKDRVFEVDQFVDAVNRVAAGGTVLDPEVVARLLSHNANQRPISRLTAREHQVIALVAEGRSNAGIAAALNISLKAVDFHIGNIFAKLDLPASAEDNRRVLAVLSYLDI